MLESRFLPPQELHSTKSCFLRDLQEENPVAWQELMYLYGPVVRFWIQRGGITSSADAADVLQEVFLAVSKYVARFSRGEGRAKFRSWLKSVTASKVADHFRARGQAAQPLGGSVGGAMLAGLTDKETPADDDAPLTQSEETALVHRAMSMIQEEFQPTTWTAFRRTAVDGVTATDVAEELGMKAAAVRKNKSRVLRRLREVLEDAGLGDCL